MGGIKWEKHVREQPIAHKWKASNKKNKQENKTTILASSNVIHSTLWQINVHQQKPCNEQTQI